MAEAKSVVLDGWSVVTPRGTKVFLAPHPDGDGCCVRFTDAGGKHTDVAVSEPAMDALAFLWEKCRRHRRAVADLRAVLRRSVAPRPANMWAGFPPRPAIEVEEFRFYEAAGVISTQGFEHTGAWRVVEETNAGSAPESKQEV